MKINLDKIDKDFMLHEHELLEFGEKFYLVQPIHIGCKWTKENMIFRSSVWNSEGELVSAGFPKFFNWGENIQLSPVPTNLRNVHLLEKVDGSLLIVSKYKKQFIHRTRGTVNAFDHKNGIELKNMIEKYPCVYSFSESNPTWNFSLLFEWVSPTNKIILDYGKEIDFIFVGMINHDDYSLKTQNDLDMLAVELELKRPKVYNFSTIDEMCKTIEAFKEKEGIVVYSKNDQVMHKLKSLWYLSLHHLKSDLSSIDKAVDVWFSFGKPTYEEFYKKVFDQFDFELAEHCKGYISNICDASKEVIKIIDGMKNFVGKIKNLPTRKDQALEIVQAYGKTNRASFVFNLLDGKELTDEQFKKLMFQVM